MTVTLATFMEVLDSSIANVALPHIAGGLGATQDEATWVLTAYLVANAIILPAGAYMTTFIGRKKFYMICVALFGISSALCGFAPSLPHAGLLPRPAGRRRRRPRTLRAGHPRRHLPARKTRPGLRHVRPRRRRARPPSAPPSAATSPTTSTGAGSSSSTSPSASSRSSSPSASSKIRPGSRSRSPTRRRAASSSTSSASACSASPSARSSSSSTRARKTTGSPRTSSPSSPSPWSSPSSS